MEKCILILSMKLYLSSYKFGNHLPELKRLMADKKRIAVIMNAVDYGDPERQQLSYSQQAEELIRIGLKPFLLDLREYFDNQDMLAGIISEIDAVWINGGNVFILQRAIEQSGLWYLLKEMVIQEKLVYAGYSAASCLAAPTLRGSEIVDDPNIVPRGYGSEFSWEGLGLLGYNLAVHYKSDHPESVMVDEEIKYYKEHDIPYKTLRDGEVLLIEKNSEKILH